MAGVGGVLAQTMESSVVRKKLRRRELEFRALLYRDILTRQHYPLNITYRIRSAALLSSTVNLRNTKYRNVSLTLTAGAKLHLHTARDQHHLNPNHRRSSSSTKTIGDYKSAKLTPNLACISCTSPTRRTRPSASTR